MSTPKDAYPIVSENGEVIPLDCIRAKAYLYRNFTTAFQEVAVVDDTLAQLAIVYATKDCILAYTNTALAENTPREAYFIPAGHALTIVLKEGTKYVRGFTESGILHIQIVERWSGTNPELSYTVR